MTTTDPKSAAPILRLLAGQRAILIGANSGTGRAVAIALGQAGADVVVNYLVLGSATRASRPLRRHVAP